MKAGRFFSLLLFGFFFCLPVYSCRSTFTDTIGGAAYWPSRDWILIRNFNVGYAEGYGYGDSAGWNAYNKKGEKVAEFFVLAYEYKQEINKGAAPQNPNARQFLYEFNKSRALENIRNASVLSGTEKEKLAAVIGKAEVSLVYSVVGDDYHLEKDATTAETAFLAEAWGVVALANISNCALSVNSTRERFALFYRDPASKNNIAIDNKYLQVGADPQYTYADESFALKNCYSIKGAQFAVLGHTHAGYDPGIYTEAPVFVDPESIAYAQENIYGFRAYKEKKYEVAAEHFKKSAALNPDYKHANFNLACTLALMGRPFAEGRPYLETILKQDGLRAAYVKKIETDDDLKAWRFLPEYGPWIEGWRYKTTPKYQFESEGLNEKQVQARLLAHDGSEAYAKKQFDVAKKLFEKAVAVDPVYLEGYVKLASVLARQGDSASCLINLDKALAINEITAKKLVGSYSDFNPMRRDIAFVRKFAIEEEAP